MALKLHHLQIRMMALRVCLELRRYGGWVPEDYRYGCYKDARKARRFERYYRVYKKYGGVVPL